MLHLLHTLFVLTWLGLVLGETAMEIVGRERAHWPSLVRFHHVIDLYLELPLIAGVVITGGLLLVHAAPDAYLWAKVAAAAVAIVANLACLVMVVQRSRALALGTDDDALRSRTSRTYFRLLAIGMPFGLLALALGALRAGWI